MGRPRTILVVSVVGFALLLAACASDEPTIAGGAVSPTPAASSPFPVTVEGSNGSVTIEAPPTKIVSLSPTATEDLFAIGAGEQVIAVDDRSNYPPEAPVTDLSGLDPNIEAIARYEPDLVVYSTEIGDLGSSLDSIGITALQLDAAVTLRGAYEQIEQLGIATGRVAEANDLVEEMRTEVDAIVGDAASVEGLTYYYELDDTYYSITSDTFIGQLFELLGLENIADAVGKGSGGYPQLSAEHIVEADPDLIFLADTKCCGQSPQTVAKRPGWDRIAAVENGNVVPLDDDVASRWGPRVVDLLRDVAEAAARTAEEAAP